MSEGGKAFWISSAGAMKLSNQNLKQKSHPAFHRYHGTARSDRLSASALPSPNQLIAVCGPMNTDRLMSP